MILVNVSGSYRGVSLACWLWLPAQRRTCVEFSQQIVRGNLPPSKELKTPQGFVLQQW